MLLMRPICLLLLLLTAVAALSSSDDATTKVVIPSKSSIRSNKDSWPHKNSGWTSKSDSKSTDETTASGAMGVFSPAIKSPTLMIPSHLRQRRLPGAEDYFDFDFDGSMGEGAALGAALVILLIVVCLLCCCCSCCCGGGRRGGGGSGCLTDILALFCCYELFCDDSPGCDFIPMDGEMC